MKTTIFTLATIILIGCSNPTEPASPPVVPVVQKPQIEVIKTNTHFNIATTDWLIVNNTNSTIHNVKVCAHDTVALGDLRNVLLYTYLSILSHDTITARIPNGLITYCTWDTLR
jgi:hypothetical protein